jgi:restriction endonuclease Mrr
MSKSRSPQVYEPPTRKFAIAEGKRILAKILKTPPAQGNEVKVIFPILKQLNPFVFEEVLLQACERWQYHAIRTEKQTKDNGIDGGFACGGYFYVLQAKLYGGDPVPEHLGMFAKAIGWHQAARGFFCHTGRATEEFVAEAARHPQIEVVSGRKLTDFLLGERELFVRSPLVLPSSDRDC